MATLEDLPRHLHEHAKAMTSGLLTRLHPGEANHRLQAVHEMAETAHRIGNPEIHRHVLAHAARLRDAMPYDEFTTERAKLRHLRDSAKNSDIKAAYFDAIRKLEDEHEQVSGVGEAIMKWDKAHPQTVSKAAQKAAVVAQVQRELRKATAAYKAEQDRIRKEIRELREQANRGRR
jgi:hypothetical protein